MKEIHTFSIAPVDGFSGYLVVDDKNLNIPTGIVLEQQYALENGWYLLLITNNCPFEESLQLILLNQNFKILDNAKLFAKIAPAVITDIKADHPTCLTFSFGDDSFFALCITQRGFWFKNFLCSLETRTFKRNFKRKFICIKRT